MAGCEMKNLLIGPLTNIEYIISDLSVQEVFDHPIYYSNSLSCGNIKNKYNINGITVSSYP